MKTWIKSLLLCLIIVPTLALAQFPIAEPGTECLRVIVTGNEDVVATYEGNSASYSNDLYYGLSIDTTDTFVFNNHASPVGSTVNLGSFDPGTELFFRLHVNNTGQDYYTGPADRNPDGQCHARVQEEWMPGTTLVSFEDLFNGPFQYNDLSFSFTNTSNCVTVCDAGGPYAGDAGVPVVFDGSASFANGCDIVDYVWEFGDGGTGTGMIVEHTYAEDGLYQVTLCVTDSEGNTTCCVPEGSVVPTEIQSWDGLKARYR